MTDHDQIALAVRAGLPDPEIAERLDCSPRTVRRVRHQRGLDRNAPSPIWGTNDEWRLWAYWNERVSVTQVARMFCRTRQAIYDGLTRLNELKNVHGVPKRRPDAQSAE